MSEPVSGPAVAIAGLLKRYGGATVLDIESLELAAGEAHVIVGPNGSGKTTLLRIIAGLERPDSGDILLLGRKLGDIPSKDAARLRRRIGFSAEKPYLFRTTVLRNVEYPLRVRGVARPERARRAREALERLGVRHLAERNAPLLSAGERERVSIARAIVSGPELVLLDEPFANVDPGAVPLVERVVLELASSGVTVAVATHLLEQAYRLSAKVVRLEEGRVAPPAVDNIIEGEIVSTDAGPVLSLEGGVGIHVVTDRRGRARAAVPPGDIILSAEPFDSSARNVLRGRVSVLRERGPGGRVRDGQSGQRGGVVLVTANAGIPLTASVTPESCRNLGLTVGSEVVLTFKATAVRFF